jgi:hypothetical protein
MSVAEDEFTSADSSLASAPSTDDDATSSSSSSSSTSSTSSNQFDSVPTDTDSDSPEPQAVLNLVAEHGDPFAISRHVITVDEPALDEYERLPEMPPMLVARRQVLLRDDRSMHMLLLHPDADPVLSRFNSRRSDGDSPLDSDDCDDVADDETSAAAADGLPLHHHSSGGSRRSSLFRGSAAAGDLPAGLASSFSAAASLASESAEIVNARVSLAERAMRPLHRFAARNPTIFYALSQLFDQVLAILPILLFLIFFRLVLLDHAALDAANAGVVIGGLVLVVIGLFFFMEGLNFAMMPLGEVIGKHLGAPGVPAWAIYGFVFVLGMLVTLCEPAINALQTLGNTVDARAAPHLAFLVHDWVDFWFITVAVGVGLASVLGLVRIRRGWSLKPLIVVLVVLTLALTFVGVFAFGADLEHIVALAWDCGGITTGPVTVPILIAYGIGVGSNRQRAAGEGSSGIEGFGIVTISAIVPIMTVILQGILLVNLYTRDELLALQDAAKAAEASEYGGISIVDTTPWQEMIISVRSVLPLAVGFMITLRLLLRKPLPRVLVALDMVREVGGRPSFRYTVFERSQASLVMQLRMDLETSMKSLESLSSSDDDDDAAAQSHRYVTYAEKQVSAREITVGGALARRDRLVQWLAIGASLLGSVCFNLGLTYGLSSLGEQTGRLLPAAFLAVSDVPDSPFYVYAGGVAVLVVFALVLGVLTTVAEPGMLVIGRKIETITHGHFRATMLVLLVAAGVAIGMTIGIVRLAFAVEFITVLVPLYALALLLTLLSSEDIVNIAWDLAGMTTGPVTVPFVLALGLNIARGVGGEGGFGILALSSICPVVTVLGFSVAVRARERIAEWRTNRSNAVNANANAVDDN